MIIKEIQGLRSLSVFLILFFHLDLSYFKLGYLAVDVFFVISGFIFSKIIFTDINDNNFNFLEYVKKRIRKLIPGLIIITFFVSLVSWLLLIPTELKYYGQSLFATSSFISNIYFFVVNNDYFSPNTYSLLHLWSLSLELQFYFIFPLLILFINYFDILRKYIKTIFFFVLIISFNLNIFFSYNEKLIFYLFPTRFWEFLIGYFIFIQIYKGNLDYSIRKNIYQYLIGLILVVYLILGSSVIIKNQILIILFTTILFFLSFKRKNFLNNFLTHYFNQFVAKYSYTIFLVHYPIIYFSKYLELYSPNFVSIIIIILLIIFSTFVVSKLEKIILGANKVNLSQKLIIKYLVILLFVNSVLGLFLHFSKGVKYRYFLNNQITKDYVSNVEHFSRSKTINENSCSLICKKITSNNKSILLFGNSHAADFELALTKILNKKKINLYLSYFDYRKTEYEPLDQLKEALSLDKVEFVFIVHHKREDDDTFSKKLLSLLNQYQETKFYYFLPRVEFVQAPMKYKLLNKPINKIEKITFENIDKYINSFESNNLEIVDQNQYLLDINKSSCNKLECFDAHDDKNLPLYRDNHHLSIYGADLFIKKLFNELSFN